MAISAGTYTCGDGTKDYSTLNAAAADCSNLTGSLTIDVQATHTLTAHATFTILLGGYELKIHSSESYRHTGYHKSNAYLITDAYYCVYHAADGTGTFEIAWINGDKTGNYGVNSFILCNNITSSGDQTIKIHNNISYHPHDQYTPAYQIRCSSTLPSYYVYNNLIFSNGGAYGLYINATATAVFENNTCHYQRYGIYVSNATPVVRNNVVWGQRTDSYFGTTNCTGYNNVTDASFGADADFASGSSGNVTEATAGDNFVSVDNSNTQFMFLLNTSTTDCMDEGVAASYSTIDIAGTARPQNGTMDIGMYEVVAAASATTGLLLFQLERHYTRGVNRGFQRGVA